MSDKTLFDFLDGPPPVPTSPTLGEALAARDEALAGVAGNAEEHSPGFSDRAAAFVLDYLARHGPSPAEVLTDAAMAAGIAAHDRRAFGPVYLALSRARRIVKAGTCARRRGHGTSGGNVWGLPPEGGTCSTS